MRPYHHSLFILTLTLSLAGCNAGNAVQPIPSSSASSSSISNAADGPTWYAPDERVTITQERDIYCGAPFAGKKHFEGTYELRYGRFALSLASLGLKFDEETDHDKTLHPLTLSADPHEQFFAFAQYASCNNKELHIVRFVTDVGFDPAPLQFCTKKTTSDQWQCSDSVLQSQTEGFSAASDHRVETKPYDNSTGTFTHILWQYNAVSHRMEAVKTWVNTYDKETSSLPSAKPRSLENPLPEAATGSDLHFTITSPTEYVIDESYPQGGYITFSGTTLTIEGTMDANVKNIIVRRQTQNNLSWLADPLPGFRAGGTTWSYKASAEIGNLDYGTNIFIFRAYLNNGTKTERLLQVNAGIPSKEVTQSAGKVTVQWTTPKKIAAMEFLKSIGQEKTESMKNFVRGVVYFGDGTEATEELIAQQIDLIAVHRVGTIADGIYKGGEVYVYTLNCAATYAMPCYAYWSPSFRLIRLPNQKIIMLTKYTHEFSNTNANPGFPVLADDDARMDIDMPETLQIPGSHYELHKIATSNEMVTETEKDILFTSTEIGKPVYADKKTGCIIVENNDGTTSIYEISYAFDPKQDPYFLQNENEKKRLTFPIAWKDGTTSDGQYSHGIFSCDPHKICYNVVTVQKGKLHTENGDFALESVGTLKTGGEEVFREVYSAADLQEFGTGSTRDLPQVYNGYYAFSDAKQQKMSVKDFYASHPVIYIKDPFGRWLRWLKEDYLPAAECGKPVIYLYPQTTKKVSVRVAPNNGFTVTDPPYGNGWNVRATPESQLTTADGTTYPYLFWEGNTNGYIAPKEGFVVAKEDIVRVLGEKLTLLGLNEKERADFLDFWVPKMQEKPYYFITFLPQESFEALAPLTVSPRPDTVIRIFMDYRGLAAPIHVQPLILHTPKRLGFTVVEWGGALNRE
ncbi:MAG: hypothetical protein WCG83_02215 [Candidatus Peregrinibacteria bacterium]